MNLFMQESSTRMRMKINSTLFNIPIINSVIEYDCTDSTNIKAKEFSKRGSVHGTLFLAHKQLNGKGRLNRTFDSKKDEGIYASLLLRPNVSPNQLPNITLLTAVAIVRALKTICHLTPLIKWPNDILLNGKKLAGILTEAGPDYVIVGIGLNTTTKSFSPDIEKTATSIFLETGKTIDSFDLLYNIMEEFNDLYEQFIIHSDFSFLLEEYNNNLANLNQEVHIIPHDISYSTSNPYSIKVDNLDTFLCRGIDENGALLCEGPDKKITIINSGEVSLRGKNSYS